MISAPSGARGSPFIGRPKQASIQETLQQLPPPALGWLNCCFHFIPHEIPLSFLDAWLQLTFALNEADLAFERKNIVTKLKDQGLIKCDEAAGTFSIHFDIKNSLAPPDSSLSDAVQVLNFCRPNQEALKELSMWASHAQEILSKDIQIEGKDDLLAGMQVWQQAQQSHAKASHDRARTPAWHIENSPKNATLVQILTKMPWSKSVCTESP